MNVEVIQAVRAFIDFIFASVLFSCIASFISLDEESQRVSTANSNSLETQTWASRYPAVFRIVDQLTRIFAVVVANLYFFLVFRTKVAGTFDNWGLVFMMVALATAGATCCGWYLFARIEFFAVGSLLIISGFFFCAFRYMIPGEADFFLWRALTHAALGMAILVAGLCHKKGWGLAFIEKKTERLGPVIDIESCKQFLRVILICFVAYGITRGFD